jgi:hypothetical protein
MAVCRHTFIVISNKKEKRNERLYFVKMEMKNARLLTNEDFLNVACWLQIGLLKKLMSEETTQLKFNH